MKRLLVLVTMLASVLVPLGIAAPAQAYCIPPDGTEVIYKFRNKQFVYHPTNLMSNWVVLRNGGSITYQQTTTKEVNASVTATVSAEAGVIFAKASTSLGITVGGSYSKSASWSYTANVPASTTYKYRLHQYHYSVNFEVMKKRWSRATCAYTTNVWSSWQRIKHAPHKSESRAVWRLDKAAA